MVSIRTPFRFSPVPPFYAVLCQQEDYMLRELPEPMSHAALSTMRISGNFGPAPQSETALRTRRGDVEDLERDGCANLLHLRLDSMRTFSG